MASSDWMRDWFTWDSSYKGQLTYIFVFYLGTFPLK